jgi:hypothetical protein
MAGKCPYLNQRGQSATLGAGGDDWFFTFKSCRRYFGVGPDSIRVRAGSSNVHPKLLHVFSTSISISSGCSSSNIQTVGMERRIVVFGRGEARVV